MLGEINDPDPLAPTNPLSGSHSIDTFLVPQIQSNEDFL